MLLTLGHIYKGSRRIKYGRVGFKLESSRAVKHVALCLLCANAEPCDSGIPEIPGLRLQPDHGLLVLQILGCVISNLDKTLFIVTRQIESKHRLAYDPLFQL